MGIISLLNPKAKLTIRNKYIEKIYACSKCGTEYRMQRIKGEVYYCPHCKSLRVSMRMKWVLKQKYRSPEGIDRIFKDFDGLYELMQGETIFRGVLKLLVDAILDYSLFKEIEE